MLLFSTTETVNGGKRCLANLLGGRERTDLVDHIIEWLMREAGQDPFQDYIACPMGNRCSRSQLFTFAL